VRDERRLPDGTTQLQKAARKAKISDDDAKSSIYKEKRLIPACYLRSMLSKQ
jgi:hypothetical protein